MARGIGTALTLATALLVAACAPTQAPAGPAAASASVAPVRGGTLVFAIWQEPSAVSTFYSNQTVAAVVANASVEGLVATDPNGEYYPVLATKVPSVQNGGAKVSADGKRLDVTYELIPGVKWSDGEPFTSADVKFTWQTILKDPKITSREGYTEIESIDTPNDTTAVVHYKSLYAPFATRFGAIMPKHLLEKEADISKSDYPRRPMGTGPFKITEFASGDHVTAERNPNYRVKDKPYLDRIIFRSVPSREVAVAQLKAGEVDGMWNLLDSLVPDLEKDTGVTILTTEGNGVERIEFNMAKNQEGTDPNSRHPVLGELAMRQALLYATPKQQIIDKLLFGKAKPGNSPVSKGWAAPKLTQEGYDPKKANDVLDKAGWVRGSDGIRSKNGVRAAVTITTTTGDQTREQVEQVLVTEWKAIGVALEIKNIPSLVLLSASWSAGDPRKHGVYDMSMYSSGPGIDPHQTVNLRYTSKQIPTPANNGDGQNYTRVQDPVIDEAVAEAGSTVDQEKRKIAYARALTRLNEIVPIIWLYERQSLEAFRTNVFGYKGSTWRDITWNLEDWFIRK